MYVLQPLLLRFYDNWVARDAEGTIFRRGFDHVARDAYGNHRMQQGLAFPVTCCWNGLAVFDAAPLQQAKVQFRYAVQCCAVQRCAVLCYAVLCCAVLCCVMPSFKYADNSKYCQHPAE